MLRTKPRLKYNGITVILSKPSRFDKLSLLTATGGVLFNQLLQPEYNSMQVDLREALDKTPFLDGTKCILLLGEKAMHEWCPDTRDNTLNELRGSPLTINNIPAIASYFPQDASDLKNYEDLNSEREETNEGTDGEDSEDGDVKRFSHTKRANYAFWLSADIRKCKELLRQNLTAWPTEKQPIYKIYPSSEEVINALSSKKGYNLEFDIETDYEEQNLQCFSFTFWRWNEGEIEWDRIVYAVPVLDYNYHWAYSSLHFIIRALVNAIHDNVLVAHNGANFDFFVLAAKYHIPVYKTYDTMVAMQRCFPEIERSLGHCTSYWTYQRFHKDTDSVGYMTQAQMMARLKYCGKDVFTMALIHQNIERYAKTIVGLPASLELAMRSIRPYLITTLTGIRYSQRKVDEVKKENDQLMMWYLRIIEELIGPTGMSICRKAVKGKAKGFPGSNAQCCNYFYEQLGYPEVGKRSEKTGKPSLGKKNAYKLALRHQNPVITFVMLYRTVAKEYGSLKFCPWRDDDGKVVNYRKWKAEQEMKEAL